jgi:NitT/TauT family transport system substrate-binding protein
VINQAAKTLLYLPLYIADRRGFFQKEGIDATIVTGGGDSQAFAAVVGGSAQFGQGDPVMVPLSLQRG